MTAAAQFQRAAADNTPAGGALSWRTVLQCAAELGATRDEDLVTSFMFPDGSCAVVIGLHSGTPRVRIVETKGSTL